MRNQKRITRWRYLGETTRLPFNRRAWDQVCGTAGESDGEWLLETMDDERYIRRLVCVDVSGHSLMIEITLTQYLKPADKWDPEPYWETDYENIFMQRAWLIRRIY